VVDPLLVHREHHAVLPAHYRRVKEVPDYDQGVDQEEHLQVEHGDAPEVVRPGFEQEDHDVDEPHDPDDGPEDLEQQEEDGQVPVEALLVDPPVLPIVAEGDLVGGLVRHAHESPFGRLMDAGRIRF
jgi:hypothetical protein